MFSRLDLFIENIGLLREKTCKLRTISGENERAIEYHLWYALIGPEAKVMFASQKNIELNKETCFENTLKICIKLYLVVCKS